MTEHAMIVRCQLSGDRFGTDLERHAVHRMEEQLRGAIRLAQAGHVEGSEFGGGAARIYTYGPDADALFAAAQHVLRATRLPCPAVAILRYGEDWDAREVRISL